MQRPEPVVQTIILAAGSGSRLASTRRNVPKPLITVAGIPLIEHALFHAHASGCSEAVVVIGHDGDRVREAIEALPQPLAVQFVTSPDPSLPNGVSLLAAEPLARRAFFLQMVDHLFAEVTLPHLALLPLDGAEGGRVLVDRAPKNLDLEDATKVRLDGRLVQAIGKGLEPWEAIDAGCFLLTHEVFTALREAPVHEPRTVSSGMRQLVQKRRLTAVDVRGIEWMDIDTPADHDAAERLLATAPSTPVV